MRGIYLSGDEEADPVGLPPLSLHVTLHLPLVGYLFFFLSEDIFMRAKKNKNILAEDKSSTSAYFRGRFGINTVMV